MNMQLLVSAMNADAKELIQNMNIDSDALIINQCDHFSMEEIAHKGNVIKFYSFPERGVGLSRNNALLRADHTISMFSDDDIVYYAGYQDKIITEFEKHPEADMILFNFEVCEARRTYWNTEFHKVSWYNCGRYPTFSFAIRTEEVHKRNITYSLLFGGGAKYSNGEDSLFIKECIQKGMKVYASSVVLGREDAGTSTWFQGYTKKFFYDRGVLYKHLYGKMATILAARFLWKHKSTMCNEISPKVAWGLMKKGMKEC